MTFISTKSLFNTCLIGVVIVLIGVSFVRDFNREAAASSRDPTSRALTVHTSFPDYYRKEPVAINLRNNSATAQRVDTAQWQIRDANGRIVATGSGIPTLPRDQIRVLRPGESIEVWRWNQKNSRGQLVKPGTYTLTSRRLKLNTVFEIRDMMGSEGLFTAGSKNYKESFRLKLTKPQAIRDAIDNFYDLNHMHVNGKLIDARPNKSPYDSQWSWYLDPQDTVMSEISMEACDARPSYVEENLDGMMRIGRFCPWGSEITGLPKPAPKQADDKFSLSR